MNSEYLRKIFKYDNETGELIWRKRDDMPPQWNGRMAGKVAGSMWFKKSGARVEKRIHINNKQYQAARVVWAYHNGDLPPSDKYVGFKDNDPMNTKIENLILSNNSKAQMKRNTNYGRRDKNGYKGVYRKGNGFRAMITKDKKTKYLGYFSDPRDAAKAYNDAAKEMFGDMATLNEIDWSNESARDIF